MYLIQDRTTLEYAYHGEGWAFTSDVGLAKKFWHMDDAIKARDEILLGDKLDLEIIEVG
jgi:hypothetical protein